MSVVILAKAGIQQLPFCDMFEKPLDTCIRGYDGAASSVNIDSYQLFGSRHPRECEDPAIAVFEKPLDTRIRGYDGGLADMTAAWRV